MQGPTFKNEFVEAGILVCVGISKGISYVSFSFQYVMTFNLTLQDNYLCQDKNFLQFKETQSSRIEIFCQFYAQKRITVTETTV